MYKSAARCKKVNVKNFVYDAQQVGSKEAHSGQHTERSEVSYTKLYYTKLYYEKVSNSLVGTIATGGYPSQAEQTNRCPLLRPALPGLLRQNHEEHRLREGGERHSVRHEAAGSNRNLRC